MGDWPENIRTIHMKTSKTRFMSSELFVSLPFVLVDEPYIQRKYKTFFRKEFIKY